MAWLLGGDGDYLGQKAERWKRIGRAVFPHEGEHLVTMHPCGIHWVGSEFCEEPWFSFLGYQSDHGNSDSNLRWLVQGPAATWCRERPPVPVINLDPNYEAFPAYQDRSRFSDREVRRAAYWSLLVSPTAGLTYGHNAIWIWNEIEGVPKTMRASAQ